MTLPDLPGHDVFEKWWPNHGLKVWRVLFTFLVIGAFGAILYAGVKGCEFFEPLMFGDTHAKIDCPPKAAPGISFILVEPVGASQGTAPSNCSVGGVTFNGTKMSARDGGIDIPACTTFKMTNGSIDVSHG
jgi:hypothetical protein